MNETEYLKGRLEALSLIVGAIFTGTPDKDATFAPRLIHLANRYFMDTPPDMQSEDFRSGFHREFDRMLATLDTPDGGALSS